MNLQTKIRLELIRDFIKGDKTLEIGIREHKITDGDSLDCVESYNPTYLCDLNLDEIPINDNFYDCVVAAEVLEHLLNPYRAVREFYRVLRKDGVLVISVPNICSLVNRINMLRGRLPLNCAEAVDEISPERHVVDFNLYSIKFLLEECGFKIEKISSNGIITNSKLITKYVPASMGETLIIKARK